MPDNVRQILIYTRPTEVLFHVELARQLEKIYPQARIRFVTFFWGAAKIAKAAGYNVCYMPHELQKVTGKEITDERFAEIDRQLYYGVGANFNLMLHCERFLPQNGDKSAEFGRKHLVVLDRLVEEGTLSISSMYDHFVYWLAGSLANIRQGWHFAFVICTFPPGRVIALKTPWETWQTSLGEDPRKCLIESRKALTIPMEERLKFLNPRLRPSTWKRWKYDLNQIRDQSSDKGKSSILTNGHVILEFIRSHLEGIRDSNYDVEQGNYFVKKYTVLNFIRPRLPQKWLRHPTPNFDIQDSKDLNSITNPFCYFPLQVPVEATVYLYSPWFRDQLELCRLISQSLPVGWKLLVKENPVMAGRKPLTYYKKIKALPNTCLVAPDIPSTDLILKAKATINIAGTASNESRVLGKPGIAIGRPPYLNMLSAGDTSRHGLFDQLFKFIQKEATDIDINEWRKWISGTFPGKAFYEHFGSNFCLDWSAENVQSYVEYIKKALGA